MVSEKHILTRFFHELVQYLEPLPKDTTFIEPSIESFCFLLVFVTHMH